MDPMSPADADSTNFNLSNKGVDDAGSGSNSRSRTTTNNGSPPRRRQDHSPDMTNSPIPKWDINNIKIEYDDEEDWEKELVIIKMENIEQVTNDNEEKDEEEVVKSKSNKIGKCDDEDGEMEVVIKEENIDQVINDNEEKDDEELVKSKSIKIGKSDDEEMDYDADDEDKPLEIDEGAKPPAAEEEEPEENQPSSEVIIESEIPKITTDFGKGLHFVKLPNFLSLETRPFDKNAYEDEVEEEETLDEEGRARLKLKVENTIRWREKVNEANQVVKESNARFVRWSDNSLSLHLGNEIFNVYEQPLQGDHNHLFIKQGNGLMGQAVFKSKLTFRPHSTDSFTHRKMTMSLADRSHKTSTIKMIGIVGKDPDTLREEKIKKEELLLRSSAKSENLKRRVRERGARGLSSAYLDAKGSDDDGVSLSAIKNEYKRGTQAQGSSRAAAAVLNIYSSSEEESEAEISNDGSDVEIKKKPKGSKRFIKDTDSESDASQKDDNAKEKKRSEKEAPAEKDEPIVKSEK